MVTEHQEQGSYYFGEFTLDLARGALLHAGEDVSLRPQSFRILQILLENHRQLVSKERFHQEVWAGVAVTDDSLTHCLADIRKAIGDTDRKVIRTVPRRGYIFEAPISVSQKNSAASSSEANGEATWRRNPLEVTAIFLGAAILVLLGWRLIPINGADIGGGKERVQFSVPASPNSIAVLPFVDLSDNQDQKYFGEALSEEIINRLTRNADIHVIARTSSFSFQRENADIEMISSRLGVAYILEGSVRRSGDQIRVTAQLIDVVDESPIWSSSFSHNMQDPLSMQSAIARNIAQALNVDLPRNNPPAVTADAITWSLFSHARHLLNQGDSSLVPEAIGLLQRALSRDPDFTRGITELSRAYNRQYGSNQIELADQPNPSRELVYKALRLAPDDAVANAWEGWHQLFLERNIDTAARHYQIAFVTEPYNVDILRGAVPVLLAVGQIDAAVRVGEYVVAHDPLCRICQRNMLVAYIYAEQLDQAHAYVKTIMSLHPDWKILKYYLARILLSKGLAQDALRVLEGYERPYGIVTVLKSIALNRLERFDEFEKTFAELPRDRSESASNLSFVYAGTGDDAAAILRLDKQLRETKFLGHSFRDPLYKHLHGDPRWQALMRRHGLAADQFKAWQFAVAYSLMLSRHSVRREGRTLDRSQLARTPEFNESFRQDTCATCGVVNWTAQ